jgi:hypothetical protein
MTQSEQLLVKRPSWACQLFYILDKYLSEIKRIGGRDVAFVLHSGYEESAKNAVL